MAGVKFCGLTRPEDACLAAELGAEYVGVIFAGGPRLLTAERAREVLAAVPTGVRRVGVFGDQSADEIVSLVDRAGLDVVQLHSARSADELRGLRRRTAAHLWAVVRVAGSHLPEELTTMAATADAVVIDSLVPGALGGTGVTVDWSALAGSLRAVGRPPRLVLAGGLRASNVAEALAIVEPDVVDVSSGVEASPGIKDPALMRAFAQTVISTQPHS
ncbi:MAG: phosphoribosylanthranilate isomerase [Gemmatimonadaceae bacterium]